VVVDCGTAVTLDVVVAGQHLGGLIVPGVNTMMKSLFRDTDQIAGAAAGEVVSGQLPLLGLNTRDAVAAGSRHMVLGFLDRHRELLRERYGEELVSIVGGGSAATMLDAVDQKWDYERHLVWRGLMIWASNRDLMSQDNQC
jgi:type III pantothenate kinase